MTRRLLITGATGLIGRQVIRLLADGVDEVHAVGHRTGPPFTGRGIRWLECDLLADDLPARLIDDVRPTHLLHLAWSVAPGGSSDPVHERWLRAGEQLITAFYTGPGERAVIAGTCFEYDWSHGPCVEEKTPIRPITRYGQCKDRLRRHTADIAMREGRSWGWARIFFVYGPGEHPQRFVPSVIRSLLAGRPARCTHGQQVRDYLHSCDVAAGMLRLLDSTMDGPCNLASGRPLSLQQLARTIALHTGGADLLQFGAIPAPADEPPMILADVTRMQSELHWRPGISLEEGLAATVEAWRTSAVSA